MQLKLTREEAISVSSWINDKPITTSDWECYTNTSDREETIQIVLVEPQTKNQVRIEINKYVKGEEL
jgi:hypothetical protein